MIVVIKLAQSQNVTNARGCQPAAAPRAIPRNWEMTMKLLHVDSSILGAGSVSRQLSAEIVAAERRLHPDIDVVYRDLALAPVGHLSGAHLAARGGAVPETPEVQADVAAGDAVMDEFLAADIVVVGAPMYNFAIASQLKAWIDRLAVAGNTFRYSEKRPEGLAGGKRVIIASSRGATMARKCPPPSSITRKLICAASSGSSASAT